jgi:hypothetical protein
MMTLREWIETEATRGDTLYVECLDGKKYNLGKPLQIGENYVAGVLTGEDRLAVPYTAVSMVRSLKKSAGF